MQPKKYENEIKKNNIMKTLKNITKSNYLWMKKSKNIKYMPNTMENITLNVWLHLFRI